MTPPTEYLEFLIGGSSNQEQTRTNLKNANFIGNEAMWLLLPPRGEIIGRLNDKFLPWRLKPGQLRWEAHRLDGDGSVPKHPAGPSGYGDIGFQAAGIEVPEAGCWEVTYTLNDQYPLPFIVRVQI